ncbi:MAG: hypothetical protein LBQ43_02500 [Holosporales bacterium]|jgi:hypothetical protein|nr:hypothetical protein [Holosporales bacterium]
MRLLYVICFAFVSNINAEINESAIKQLQVPKLLKAKLKGLFPILEQCKFALTNKNMTLLRKSYDDLSKEFILISPEIERILCQKLEPLFLNVLSLYALSIYFYGRTLCSPAKAEHVGEAVCGEILKKAPILGNIFKIFIAEAKSKANKRPSPYKPTANKKNNSATEILKMSSFDKNWVKIESDITSMHLVNPRSDNKNCEDSNGKENTKLSKSDRAERDNESGDKGRGGILSLSNENSKEKKNSKHSLMKMANEAACKGDATGNGFKGYSATIADIFPTQDANFTKIASRSVRKGKTDMSDAHVASKTLDSLKCSDSAGSSQFFFERIDEEDVAFGDISQYSTDDVLLALCCLSLYCQQKEPNVVRKIEQVKRKVGKQLMNKPLNK